MQPGDPDVVDDRTPAPNTRAVSAASWHDRRVRRPGRHDGHAAARLAAGRRTSPRADLVDHRVRQLFPHGGRRLVGEAGRQHAAIGVGLAQPGEQRRPPVRVSCRRRRRPPGRRCGARARRRAGRTRGRGSPASAGRRSCRRTSGPDPGGVTTGRGRLRRDRPGRTRGRLPYSGGHAWSPARPLRLPRTRGNLHRGGAALAARRRPRRSCCRAAPYGRARHGPGVGGRRRRRPDRELGRGRRRRRRSTSCPTATR